MLITSSWIADLVVVLTLITFFLYKYTTRKFDYWKKRGVQGPQPLPFFGNALDLCIFKKAIGDWLRDIYNYADEPYIGIFIFDEPVLIIKSPEIIKQIMVKDFYNFTDRTVASAKHNNVFLNLMFFQKGSQWKKGRASVTPVFTSGKLKGMLPIIDSVGHDIVKHLKINLGVVETKEAAAKYAIDVIGKCFFGISPYSFDKENAEFRRLGREMFSFNWRNAIAQSSYFFREGWVNLFHLDFFDSAITDYFREAFWTTYKLRENSSDKTNDLIDILKESSKNGNLFDKDVVTGHAIMFFAAGFETTSSTISYALYELCLAPHIQTTVRDEIISNIKEHQGLTYESLAKMKYLDMCINETLRKYPVLPFLDRKCAEDYKIPGTDMVLEKGLGVYIPMYGLHLDEKLFPEPCKFIPERFDDKNFNTLNPSYVPFGDGPRRCIGERFGLMSVKVCLVHILSNFQVDRCDETPVPVVFEPKSFVLASKVGLPMKIKLLSPSPAIPA